MKPDKVIEELDLKTYEYVKNENSFVHLEKSSEKNCLLLGRHSCSKQLCL